VREKEMWERRMSEREGCVREKDELERRMSDREREKTRKEGVPPGSVFFSASCTLDTNRIIMTRLSANKTLGLKCRLSSHDEAQSKTPSDLS
jgi:hypothetical protein